MIDPSRSHMHGQADIASLPRKSLRSMGLIGTSFFGIHRAQTPCLATKYTLYLALAPIHNSCRCTYLGILSSTPLNLCNYSTLRYIFSTVNLPQPRLLEFTQSLPHLKNMGANMIRFKLGFCGAHIVWITDPEIQ